MIQLVVTLAVAALAVSASSRTVEVLSKNDLWSVSAEVKEAAEVARESFLGSTTECSADPEDDRRGVQVQRAIQGSFTSKGAKETMYSVRISRCNDLPSAPAEHYLVVYREGAEVWRTVAPEAVRAVDVDGDGQDEWLELSRWCAGTCRTEAWVAGIRRGEAKTLHHVKEAERSDCTDGGSSVTTTTLTVTDGVEKRSTTTSGC